MRTCLTIAALSLALASTSAAQDAKVYDWTFVEGRAITYSMTSKQAVRTTLGQKQTGDLDYVIDTTQVRRTLSRTETTAELELAPTAMRVRVRYGKANVEWDSSNRRLRKARSLPYIKSFAAQYDRKTVFTMDIPGRSVRDLRFEPTNGASSLSAPPPTASAARGLESGRRLFPATPVAKGDSWEWNTRSPFDGVHDITWTGARTLTGFETVDGQRCAKVEGERTGKVVAASGEASVETHRATESEVTLFDIERGFVLKSESSWVLETSTVLNVQGQGEKTERTSMTNSQTVAVTGVEGGD